MDRNRIDPGHNLTRNVLRAIGPLAAVTGLIFFIVGLADILSQKPFAEEPPHLI